MLDNDIKSKELSKSVRRRLPAYFRTMLNVYANGCLKISSDELAHLMSLTPSQIRTDMLAIGCSGQKGYGYLVINLYKRIAELLQLTDKYSAVMVSGSKISEVIADLPIFTKRGVKLKGVFSADITQENSNLGSFKLMPLDDFNMFCIANMPNILILACDIEVANLVMEKAKEMCFTEVWNFSDQDLSCDFLPVKNVHFSDQLMVLCSEIENN